MQDSKIKMDAKLVCLYKDLFSCFSQKKYIKDTMNILFLSPFVFVLLPTTADTRVPKLCANLSLFETYRTRNRCRDIAPLPKTQCPALILGGEGDHPTLQ